MPGFDALGRRDCTSVAEGPEFDALDRDFELA